MLWNRTRNQILEDWRESLDYSLEAGGTPLFDIGLSHNTLDGLLSLSAAQSFSAASQPTLAYPLLTIGGNSPLWLLTLDPHWLGTTAKPVQPNEVTEQKKQTFTTAFTAIDPATHIASLTVNTDPAKNMSSRAPKVQATGLPTAFQSLTLPQLEPAVISTWQALPLTISSPKPQLRSQYSTLAVDETMMNYGDGRIVSDPTTGAEPNTPESQPSSWIAAVSLVTCILMIAVSILG